jgi:hypothetical protein
LAGIPVIFYSRNHYADHCHPHLFTVSGLQNEQDIPVIPVYDVHFSDQRFTSPVKHDGRNGPFMGQASYNFMDHVTAVQLSLGIAAYRYQKGR